MTLEHGNAQARHDMETAFPALKNLRLWRTDARAFAHDWSTATAVMVCSRCVMRCICALCWSSIGVAAIWRFCESHPLQGGTWFTPPGVKDDRGEQHGRAVDTVLSVSVMTTLLMMNGIWYPGVTTMCCMACQLPHCRPRAWQRPPRTAK